MTFQRVHCGDCLDVVGEFDSESVDLVYLDPPFLTQKTHRQSGTRGRFAFDDIWASRRSYAEFMHTRLVELHRVLASHGSIVLHCDRSAHHVARLILDDVFGEDNFRAEIVWHYRRWSNARRGLLPAHQSLLWYSKGRGYVFNRLMTRYSPSTNVDQILQRRTRDARNKTVYMTDEDGSVVTGGTKKGVPLSDVWDIPYLNPRAKERVGYPTQKPVALLERVINVFSRPGHHVLDPFCGSGTALVASLLTGRSATGIDISEEAVLLSRQRLEDPVVSRSAIVASGRAAFDTAPYTALAVLGDLDVVPVQRNRGIDAFLQAGLDDTPVPIRVQRRGESVTQAALKLLDASQGKGVRISVLVRTRGSTPAELAERSDLLIVDTAGSAILRALADRAEKEGSASAVAS